MKISGCVRIGQTSLLVTTLLFATKVFSNGAIYIRGASGGSLALIGAPPDLPFVVDENVIIDVPARLATVEYRVANTGDRPVQLSFAFPVARIGIQCFEGNVWMEEDDDTWQQTFVQDFDFSASLNGAPLTSTYKTSSDVELPESHVALAESV